MENASEVLTSSTSVFYAFKPCATESFYGLIFCYSVMSLCFLLGTPAHVFSLWLHLRFGWKIKQGQVFQLSYTVLELIACIECAMEVLNEFVFQNETLFVVYVLIFAVSWTGRALIQTCICIEQYIGVKYPLIFLRYKGIKYRVAGLMACVLIAVGYGLYEIKFRKFPDPIFNSVFISSVVVISFCCVSVLRALKNPGPGDAHMQNQRDRDTRNQQKTKAFNTIFITLLIVLLSYIPQVVVTICNVLSYDWVMYYCNLGPIMVSLSILSLMITPLMKLYKEAYLKCSNRAN